MGRETMESRATAQWHAILDSYEDPGMLPGAEEELTEFVARRKAEVIAAVHGGLLTMAEACNRYRLSSEEFLEWERHYKEHGLDGLRASIRPTPPPVLH